MDKELNHYKVWGEITYPFPNFNDAAVKILLIWINFNPIMDKELNPLQSVGRNYLSIPKLQRCSC